jgi:XTP/dITP diphosphohydrolase
VIRLLVASSNPHKIAEIRGLVDDDRLQIVTLASWPSVAAPEETGTTFAENARAKALYYAGQTGELTLAEDSGLEIDALGGGPGVHSARYGGAAADYPEKFQMIYAALAETGVEESTARFVCAAAVARPGAIVYEATGVVEGRIAPEPRGSGGFGYDPIFFYPPFGTTLADAGDRKHLVSHRAAAMRDVLRWLLTKGEMVRHEP